MIMTMTSQTRYSKLIAIMVNVWFLVYVVNCQDRHDNRVCMCSSASELIGNGMCR